MERHTTKRLFRSLLRSWSGIIGLLIFLTVITGAIAAPKIAPADPIKGSIVKRLKPPSWKEGGSKEHLLGTDQLGRDVLSRIVWGARISLMVGFLSVAVSGTVGVTLGVVAGYYRGWVERTIMRIADIQLAMPFVLLVISIVAVVGANLTNIIIVLGVSGWVVYARVVRSQVLTIRDSEYVQAARALGASDARIIVRHILPNILPSTIVIASLSVAQMIILESLLSFLGLGVQPPTPTWGSMLADSRDYLVKASWMATFPGLAILLCVLGVNLLGDWLRDALDPRIQV